jgi:predicted chitinase
LLTVFATLGEATGFKADRDAFFRNCGVLTNFELDETKTKAVATGKTRLSESMKTGISTLFDAWERADDSDKRRLAFVLATARRESQGSFAPLREAPKCRDDEACRERVIGNELARRAKENNRPVPANYAKPAANGQRYYGRGFVQLTHHSNYKRAGDALQLDLVSNPDKALETAVAADILVRGMLEGWFGSRKPLSHYIDRDKADWINARNNVNPKSPNKPITAAMALEFLLCLGPDF